MGGLGDDSEVSLWVMELWWAINSWFNGLTLLQEGMLLDCVCPGFAKSRRRAFIDNAGASGLTECFWPQSDAWERLLGSWKPLCLSAVARCGQRCQVAEAHFLTPGSLLLLL